MKALLRRPGETVTEDMCIAGIDWQTGAPLTDPAWSGGPYQLVENYIELPDGVIHDVYVYPEPEDVPEVEEATPAPEVEEDTVVINGVTYTKAQLREMLGE